jgi:type II secretion system protein N
MGNMSKSFKETMYWSAVVFYGILLVGLLLYLRFPAEKFRKFSGNFIEEMIPGVSCSIGKTGYGFPLKIQFENVRLSDAANTEVLFYEDALLSIEPSWRNLSSAFILESRAFGGSHTAKVLMKGEGGATIELRDFQISRLDLDKLPYLRRKIDRKITGMVDAQGSLVIDREKNTIAAAQGNVAISDGTFELKKPLLELTTLEIKESTFSVGIKEKQVEISDGKLRNPKLRATFAGEIALAEPWLAGALGFQGEITPLTPLYQERKGLKTIVSRMQKQYGGQSLPFTIGGTLGRPTFVFAR